MKFAKNLCVKHKHNPPTIVPPLQIYFAAVVNFSLPHFELICVIPPNKKRMSLK